MDKITLYKQWNDNARHLIREKKIADYATEIGRSLIGFLICVKNKVFLRYLMKHVSAISSTM